MEKIKCIVPSHVILMCSINVTSSVQWPATTAVSAAMTLFIHEMFNFIYSILLLYHDIIDV